jgi:hypothetical protein
MLGIILRCSLAAFSLLQIVEAQDATVQGIVKSDSGNPLSEAVVQIKREGDRDLKQVAISDPKGNFGFKLPPGRYQISVDSYRRSEVKDTATGMAYFDLQPGITHTIGVTLVGGIERTVFPKFEAVAPQQTKDLLGHDLSISSTVFGAVTLDVAGDSIYPNGSATVQLRLTPSPLAGTPLARKVKLRARVPSEDDAQLKYDFIGISTPDKKYQGNDPVPLMFNGQTTWSWNLARTSHLTTTNFNVILQADVGQGFKDVAPFQHTIQAVERVIPDQKKWYDLIVPALYSSVALAVYSALGGALVGYFSRRKQAKSNLVLNE